MADQAALSNRLFARRAAIIANRAASWVVDTLGLDPDAPVSAETAELFAQEIRHTVHIIVRDAKANGQ